MALASFCTPLLSLHSPPRIPSRHFSLLHASLFPARHPIPTTKTPTLRSISRIPSLPSRLTTPIVSPDDHWSMWTALFAIGTFGLWSEERTKIGSMVSAALVSTLVGLGASNLGLVPYETPAYSVVSEFLLPLTIPLLLLRADMRRVLRSTGTLLLAFLLGSIATVIGTLVAFLLVPMQSLGSDNWKIAAALMGSYIGGSVNYVAISEALGTSASVVTAGVAVDNVICAIYFMVLFALASKIPPEVSTSTNDVELVMESRTEGKIQVLQTASALALSFMICKAATYLIQLFKIQGSSLPIVTAIAVVLATVFPVQSGALAPAGGSMALILMQNGRHSGLLEKARRLQHSSAVSNWYSSLWWVLVGAYGMPSTQHRSFSCLL